MSVTQLKLNHPATDGSAKSRVVFLLTECMNKTYFIDSDYQATRNIIAILNRPDFLPMHAWQLLRFIKSQPVIIPRGIEKLIDAWENSL